jgi:hypothetical protein
VGVLHSLHDFFQWMYIMGGYKMLFRIRILMGKFLSISFIDKTCNFGNKWIDKPQWRYCGNNKKSPKFWGKIIRKNNTVKYTHMGHSRCLSYVDVLCNHRAFQWVYLVGVFSGCATRGFTVGG